MIMVSGKVYVDPVWDLVFEQKAILVDTAMQEARYRSPFDREERCFLAGGRLIVKRLDHRLGRM